MLKIILESLYILFQILNNVNDIIINFVNLFHDMENLISFTLLLELNESICMLYTAHRCSHNDE